MLRISWLTRELYVLASIKLSISANIWYARSNRALNDIESGLFIFAVEIRISWLLGERMRKCRDRITIQRQKINYVWSKKRSAATKQALRSQSLAPCTPVLNLIKSFGVASLLDANIFSFDFQQVHNFRTCSKEFRGRCKMLPKLFHRFRIVTHWWRTWTEAILVVFRNLKDVRTNRWKYVTRLKVWHSARGHQTKIAIF